MFSVLQYSPAERLSGHTSEGRNTSAFNPGSETHPVMSEPIQTPPWSTNRQSWLSRTLATAMVLSVVSTAIGCTMIVPPRETAPAAATGNEPAATNPGSEVSVDTPVPAHVLRVLSGDTIEVELNGHPVLVRYLFADSPDPGEELYNEAAKLNQLLVGNADVLLVAGDTDKDEDGRLLRYVVTGDGLLVNEHMIAEGMARYEPKSDTSLHHTAMAEAEMAAMELGIGVWR